MINKSKIKSTFDAEKSQAVADLLDIITKNNVSNFQSYKSWQKYFSKYIDPVVIHRKKDVKEFEKKFNADFFEILFSIHLIVYLFGKQILRNINIPKKLQKSLQENLFEEAFAHLPSVSQATLVTQVENIFQYIQEQIDSKNIYGLLENIYRVISPREIRKPLGEYFTPLSLATKMVEEVDTEKDQELWMDNSSGFGVFLLAYLRKFGAENIDKFVCIEINPLSVFISKVAVAYEFNNHLDKIKALPIHWGDTLLNKEYKYNNNSINENGDFSKYFNKIGVVIGNPPWVSWKSMTKEYQALIGDDWRSYDIFEKNITRKTLGACNDDISSYFVYYSIDKFLQKQGLLSFVINLSLFKSNLVGKQFRQFNIKKNKTPFRLAKIFDLTEYKVFEGITNSYCIFNAIKGEKTTYPVPYILLTNKNKDKVQTLETTARPLKNEDGGALITTNGNEELFNAIEGVCEYKARAGVCTWLNSAYWVRKVDENDLATIINLGNTGKKKLKEVKHKVEKELLFRLLRARNLKDFSPLIENHIIVPQTQNDFSKPIPIEAMKIEYRHAYNFFLNFEQELLERSGYKKFLQNKPFYGLYNIGPYTKAPIKLGWQFISKEFRVYLINNAEDIVPDLNVMFIPLEDIEEAYYLHALLNSKYSRKKIEASSNWTFPSGSIKKIYLERYDKKNKLHSEIAGLQKKILHEPNPGQEREMDTFFKEYWFNGRKKKKSAKESQLSLV